MVKNTEVEWFALSGGNDSGRKFLQEIMARLESLESRLEVMDKRRAYQRNYMREKRK